MLIPESANRGFTKEEMAEMSSGQDVGGGDGGGDGGGVDDGDGGEEQQDVTIPQSETPSNVAEKPAQKQGGKPPQGYVPQAALHEARQQAKAAKEKADRIEAMWNKLQQDQKAAEEAAKKAAEPKLPDFETDPAGHIIGKQEAIARKLEEAEKREQERVRREREVEASNQMLTTYATAVDTYSRTPEGKDFAEAYEYLLAARDRELAFIFQDPAERQNRLKWEEGSLVGYALQRGINPGKMLHDMAVERGFKAAPPKDQSNKIDRLAAGQKAAKSLSGGGVPPGSGDADLSITAMLQLEDSGDTAAIEAAWEKMRRASRRG